MAKSMFELLVALDKLVVFSKPVALTVPVKLKPGMIVTVVNDQIVLPPTAGYSPVYVVLSDQDEPVTIASGTVGIAFGDMRFVTDQVESGTYKAGFALVASTNGKLKKYDGSVVADYTPNIIGYVEQVTPNAQAPADVLLTVQFK